MELAATPTTKASVPSLARVIVSWSLAMCQVAAWLSACTNRVSNEPSGHSAMVETPGVMVILFEPLVL